MPSRSVVMGTGLPPVEIVAIVWPRGGRNTCVPLTSGRNRTSVARPPCHAMSISSAPRTRRPVTRPLGHARGSAGSSAISPAWLCTSISAIAAVAPKLPSI